MYIVTDILISECLQEKEVCTMRKCIGIMGSFVLTVREDHLTLTHYSNNMCSIPLDCFTVQLRSVENNEYILLNYKEFVKYIKDDLVYMGSRAYKYKSIFNTYSFVLISLNAYRLSNYIKYKGFVHKHHDKKYLGANLCKSHLVSTLKVIDDYFLCFNTTAELCMNYSNYAPEFIIKLWGKDDILGFIKDDDKIILQSYEEDVSYGTALYTGYHVFKITNMSEFKKIVAKAMLMG